MKQIFINAAFHLMDITGTVAKGLLVENGKIIKVLNDTKQVYPDYELVDLKGSYVYPGFIDTHTHSFEGGLYSQSLDLSPAQNISQVLEMLSDYYQSRKQAQAIQLDAFRFDENKITEQRFPYSFELDEVCPDLPLVLRRIDGHSSLINSKAWKVFGAANESVVSNKELAADLTSRVVGKADYWLKGDLNDKVVHWFHASCPPEEIIQAYQKAAEIALANGITTIHTMVGDARDSIMHYALVRDKLKSFPIEFILYPQSYNLKAALDAGAKRIGGCILADGALGSYTAALSEPYNDKPDSTGRLYHADGFWENFITEAHKHDLQVAVHCIGDKAIRQINNVYLKLARQNHKDLRHELIHCELTPDTLVEEISASGAIPVMQPAFDLYWGGSTGFYNKVLGTNRSSHMNRFRSFSQRGVQITGGSDWYITELDAIQGINAAMHHHTNEERLTAYDAISMYTRNAARLSHDEHRLGQLSEGFEADMVSLDKKIMEDEDKNICVLMTYKLGKLIYAKS